MNKVNIKYLNRKNEIFDFYNHFNKIDVDNIEEVNDHIVDIDLKKEHFDNSLEEFFNILSMCSYMVEHELYDEYFFETYKEILEDYNNGNFDELFLDINDKELMNKDIDSINEVLKKDEVKNNYYDNLTDIYNKGVKNEK